MVWRVESNGRGLALREPRGHGFSVLASRARQAKRAEVGIMNLCCEFLTQGVWQREPLIDHSWAVDLES